ncbi:MAG: FAD-binding protein [Betaproteobacteria bacterium]|nr:FAD-binding protein [Betaproteobacteria bacterium]
MADTHVSADVLHVVGAGLAGLAAAITFARAGRNVVVRVHRIYHAALPGRHGVRLAGPGLCRA